MDAVKVARGGTGAAELVGLNIALAIILATASLHFSAPAAASAPGEAPAESSLDIRVFRVLNGGIVNPVFDTVLPFVTDFKKWRIFALGVWLGLVILGGRKGRWVALLLIPLVAASDQLTSSVIKPLTMRLRPCEVLGNVHFWHQGTHWIWTPSDVVGGFKTSFGFPSSHAANFTASMLLLSLAYRRWVPYVCLPFAGLVSLSRIYIGVHWPSDVLVGIVIGAALGWIAYLGFRRILSWRKPRPAATDRP